jgi:NADH-quinone oxidoreductase subunit C
MLPGTAFPEGLRDNPVAAALENLATAAKLENGEVTIEVAPGDILEALRRAKHSLNFEQLTTVTGVDRYPAEPRYEVVYHLHSFSKKLRLRLKVRISSANPEIESSCAVYRSGNWYEREIFDFFGVRFLNHPDMRRIMMPDEWEGHPLRKDYPITGTRY